MDSLFTSQFQVQNIQYKKYTSFFNKLKIIYEAMDQRYKGVADYRGKMAFMATYNIDSFRDFVLNSNF